MPEDSPKPLDTLVHDLLQQLQVIEMAAASIERSDAGRYAKVIAAVRRAAAELEQGVEALAARARERRD